jgi:hypothetical protein
VEVKGTERLRKGYLQVHQVSSRAPDQQVRAIEVRNGAWGGI